MKIAPLIIASATALETASTANNLLAAVGHRNATKMEALVQGLVEESISEPAWKFDQDIKNALNLIKDMFVVNIQAALKDQHSTSQVELNTNTKTCFGGCNKDLCEGVTKCQSMEKKCEQHHHMHMTCRHQVKVTYIHMAQSCGALHSFIQNWQDDVCTPESCLCPELTYCHKKSKDDYGEEVCTARNLGCPSKYGEWLMEMVNKYKAGFAQWEKFYKECKKSYHAFLTVDMQCDATQKGFEKCMCEMNTCQNTAVEVDFPACSQLCWDSYKEEVKNSECLEKDRKIDWSATKKIECYVDILLHNYTKEELLSKCGTEDCINKAREEDYRYCHTICNEVDFEGAWPEVISMDQSWEKACDGPIPVKVDGHPARPHTSQYLLGDAAYKHDLNGVEFVFTKHRGNGKTRAEEERCTEHLDIDYPVPPCVGPPPPPAPVCDCNFHHKFYASFDVVTKIDSISDCCYKNGKTCFEAVPLDSCTEPGVTLTEISVTEHSEAWAYNRCPCMECVEAYPEVPPVGWKCMDGAHSLEGSAYR
jgi:hypothetical protein